MYSMMAVYSCCRRCINVSIVINVPSFRVYCDYSPGGNGTISSNPPPEHTFVENEGSYNVFRISRRHRSIPKVKEII
jgi:hypothetical protein